MFIALIFGVILFILLVVVLMLKTKKSKRFVIVSSTISVALCAVYSVWIIEHMNQGTDAAWGPVLAALGSALLFPGLMLIITMASLLWTGLRSKGKPLTSLNDK